MNTSRITASIKAIAVVIFAGTASALAAVPAAAQALPSYATGSADETIHGTVAAVNGAYDISVRDARGYLDNVTLHRGTIINPTGLTLAPGQSVTILGRTQGNAFAENEIDVPYQSLASLPLYPAYGYLGYPYRGYAYGPYPAYRVGVAFGRGFGFRGW